MKRFLPILLLLLVGCNSPKKETISRNPYKNLSTPQWIKTAIEYDTTSLQGNYKRGRKSYAKTEEAVREFYSRLQNSPQEAYTPFYNYQLGLNLLRINEQGAAYHYLQKAYELPDSAPFTNKVKRLETHAKLKDITGALTLRTVAKRGYKEAFNKLNHSYTPHFDDARLHYAYALMLQKDTSGAIKACEAAIDTTNYRRLYKRSSITAGVAHILYSLGEHKKLFELTQWMIDIGDLPSKGSYMKYNSKGEPDDYFVNQWKSSYDIVERFRNLSTSNKESAFTLNDGMYSSSVRGFIDTLSVHVTIKASKIDHIEVTNSKDDRPFSALKSIPKRIVDAQSLGVDAVTEATVTSTAIIAATAEALQKARK